MLAWEEFFAKIYPQIIDKTAVNSDKLSKDWVQIMNKSIESINQRVFEPKDDCPEQQWAKDLSVGEIVVQTLPTIYMRRIAHNLDVEATKKFYQRMTQYFREMIRIAKLTIKEETCSTQVNFELQRLHKER